MNGTFVMLGESPPSHGPSAPCFPREGQIVNCHCCRVPGDGQDTAGFGWGEGAVSPAVRGAQ